MTLPDTGVALLLGLVAVFLWRQHIYANAEIVPYRGGVRPLDTARAAIAAIAFSRPLPFHCAFLGPDDRVLLDVPIAFLLPRRELISLAKYLNVPVL